MDLVAEHLGRAGQAFQRRPVVWLPEFRPDESLRALQVALFDLDGDREHRPFAPRTERRQPSLIPNEDRPPVDAQRLTDTGHQKQQPNATGLHNVAKAVEPTIARPVGDQQRSLIDHVDESRRIAPRRRIAPPVRPMRTHHDKRRMGDEPTHVLVEHLQFLADRDGGRSADDRGEFLARCDSLRKLFHGHGSFPMN